jgi:Na+/proline symporter
VTTQAVQGLFILLLSFVLIPFALDAVGGWSGAQAALAALNQARLADGNAATNPADWFGLFAGSEITLFYVVMAVLNALVGVTVQPHHMSINGSGKDEIACRTGWTYGNFLKRFATLGWALSGVLIAASFPDALVEGGRSSREAAFGLAGRALLPAGLTGLLLAAIVAAVVASASTFMTGGSALFTRNFYRRFLRPDASEAHYLTVGRLSSVAVVALGVATALLLPSVLDGLEWIWRFMAFLGVSFWGALFWRRANRTGAWASVVAMFACALATSPVVLGDAAWSFPAQIALYLPVGVAALVAGSLLTRPEDDGLLNTFYSLLRTPVGMERRLREARIETIHEVDAPAAAQAGGTRESALEPSIGDPAPDRVPLLSPEPARETGQALLLADLPRIGRFDAAHYRTDLRGFALAWAIVAGFLVLASVLSAVLS